MATEQSVPDAELAEVSLLDDGRPRELWVHPSSASNEELRPRRMSLAVAGSLLLGCAALSALQHSPLALGSGGLRGLLGLSGTASTAGKKSCLLNEEEYAGLCYMQCRVLTGGKANHRRSPTQCCELDTFLCGFVRSMTTTSGGLSVGGGEAQEALPHPPGAGGDCAEDQEPFQGQCYGKCSILTNNTQPNRVGIASCCGGSADECLAGGGQVVTNGAFATATPPTDINDDNMLKKGKLTIGGACKDQEEKFNGLCYMKCSLLTGGQMIHRTGPMSCCSQDEGIFQWLTCMWPTHTQTDLALNVAPSSDNGMGKEPHPPGMSVKCLEDEEEFVGLCYRKCSMLTGGKKPYRTGVNSCCADASAQVCESQPEDVLVSVLADTGGQSADGLPHGPYLTP